jgi:hypothetical protein
MTAVKIVEILIYGIVSFICGFAACAEWLAAKQKRPLIRLDSPCPACGHPGCKVAYDPAAKMVNRTCDTCGCTVRQLPVAPHLFEQKK